LPWEFEVESKEASQLESPLWALFGNAVMRWDPPPTPQERAIVTEMQLRRSYRRWREFFILQLLGRRK